MKPFYLIVFVLLFSNFLSAQTDSVPVQEEIIEVYEAPAEEPQVFVFVEQMPEFPGGDTALTGFISRNIKYPQLERDADIQGRVYVKMIVNEDGHVSNAVIARGVSPGIDTEALRVVNMLPPFKPGTQQGKPVKVQYIVPINFILK